MLKRLQVTNKFNVFDTKTFEFMNTTREKLQHEELMECELESKRLLTET